MKSRLPSGHRAGSEKSRCKGVAKSRSLQRPHYQIREESTGGPGGGEVCDVLEVLGDAAGRHYDLRENIGGGPRRRQQHVRCIQRRVIPPATASPNSRFPSRRLPRRSTWPTAKTQFVLPPPRKSIRTIAQAAAQWFEDADFEAQQSPIPKRNSGWGHTRSGCQIGRWSNENRDSPLSKGSPQCARAGEIASSVRATKLIRQ